MSQSLFSATSYKVHLTERLDDTTRGGGRGARARLSEALGCQTAYTAQVLRGDANFSLEQAEVLNTYLRHDETESLYFVLLVQYERSGSVALKKRLQHQLSQMRAHHLTLKNRVSVPQPLSEKHQSVYYSSWLYGAAHALASIPEFRTPEEIAKRLNISARRAHDVMDFLVSCGLVGREKNSYRISTAGLHLKSDSPLINRHHTNWRVRTIQALDTDSSTSALHYSSVVSISRHDADRIQEVLIQAIQKAKTVIRDSSEEELRVFCIDFYEPHG